LILVWVVQGAVALTGTAATDIPNLNAGVTSADGILFQMSPPIANASIANYTEAVASATGNAANVIYTFTHSDGTAP